MSQFPGMTGTLEDAVGRTPLVSLKRLPVGDSEIWLKLEGNNPAGSVKDRPVLSMVLGAEKRGELKHGQTLVEATSGNTGIAMAMMAALRGYPMILVMPDNLPFERRQAMTAYGARLELTSQEVGMEGARDRAAQIAAQQGAYMLNQFANPDNPLAHYRSTGPEIWQQTNGRITHFVSAMGTTGTIMGVSRYLKEQSSSVRIIGCQPSEGSHIPGIRKWPQAYLPKIYDPQRIDQIEEVSQQEAEAMTRRLAREEGLFVGISSGGATAVALRLARQLTGACIVTIACDRGDRYLSANVFDAAP